MRARKARVSRRELRQRGGLGHRHQARDRATARAPRRQRHLHQRDGEREDEGEMSELDDHGLCARVDSLSPCHFGMAERVRGEGQKLAPAPAREPPLTPTLSPR